MKRNNRHIFLSFFIVVLLLIGSTTAVFGATQITRTYSFIPEDKTNLKYDIPKTVKEDGDEYELKDVKYSLSGESKKITESITIDDKKDFPKTKTEVIDGMEITLEADPDIEWKEVTSEGIVKVQEYKNRNDIPQELKGTKPDEDGNQMNIVLQRTGIENISRTERFSAPAKFYSPTKNGKLYMFDGKKVSVSGNSPVWDGYKEDVKNYLGLNGNSYSITGGAWTGQAVKQDDKYVRTASFSGTKAVPLYRATFTETADTTTKYQAEVTYSYPMATATATYEKTGLSIAQLIAIGVGLLLLIATIIGIIYIISKRRKQREEDI